MVQQGWVMPEVNRFFGISIRMYFDDHNPPHFHAIYAGMEVKVGIDPIAVLSGRFKRRALGMVMEWTALRQRQLLENWELLRNSQPPLPIDPLE
jgi:hypothetical protein